MIHAAQISIERTGTLCPLAANNHEAGKFLITKAPFLPIFENEADKILKNNQLPNTIEATKLGDKLFAIKGGLWLENTLPVRL